MFKSRVAIGEFFSRAVEVACWINFDGTQNIKIF